MKWSVVAVVENRNNQLLNTVHAFFLSTLTHVVKVYEWLTCRSNVVKESQKATENRAYDLHTHSHIVCQILEHHKRINAIKI